MDELQVKGRIFDIQRFSVHDGPGVRTIVFLKAARCAANGAVTPNRRNMQYRKWYRTAGRKQ